MNFKKIRLSMQDHSTRGRVRTRTGCSGSKACALSTHNKSKEKKVPVLKLLVIK